MGISNNSHPPVGGLKCVGYNQGMAVKFKKTLAMIVTGLVVFGGAMGLIYMSYVIVYWERVYPGVMVAGVDLGHKSQQEVRTVLINKTSEDKVLILRWNKTLERRVAAAEISWKIDVDKTVSGAMTVGRGRNMWTNAKEMTRARAGKMEVDLVVNADEEKIKLVISDVAGQIDLPVKEPEISVDVDNGITNVSVSPGKSGQVVDDQSLARLIKEAMLLKRSGEIDIPVKVLEPKLSPQRVLGMKDRVGKIYGRKIVLEGDGQKWELTGERLVPWLDPIEKWKQNEIASWVGEFAKGFDRPAQNAFFRYDNGRVKEFKPGNTGVAVEQETLAGLILEALNRLELSDMAINLAVPYILTDPEVKTAEVNDLGITELLARGESRFTGSIPNRVFNIKHAAQMMDGVLIAPGETFSFNAYVGDISQAGGYKPGYIIKDGKTVLGDGGGVCQVSSTMFRAALGAGLPIEERWAHAYRVSYYELDVGPGYDATIFTPSVDLRFKNDTPAYILIQTQMDEANYKLAFELYGTRDGRKVSFSKTRVWDRVAPPPNLYIDDPNLPKGKTKQTEHSIYGAKVAFDWKVVRGEEVLQNRTFFSNFQPWQGVYLVGTRI